MKDRKDDKKGTSRSEPVTTAPVRVVESKTGKGTYKTVLGKKAPEKKTPEKKPSKSSRAQQALDSKRKSVLDLKSRTLSLVLDDIEGWDPDPASGEVLGECLTGGVGPAVPTLTDAPVEDQGQDARTAHVLAELEGWKPGVASALGPSLIQKPQPKTDGPLYTPPLSAEDEDDADEDSTARVDMAGNTEYEELLKQARKTPHQESVAAAAKEARERLSKKKKMREPSSPPYEPRIEDPPSPSSRAGREDTMPTRHQRREAEGAPRTTSMTFVIVGICSMVGAALGTWLIFLLHGPAQTNETMATLQPLPTRASKGEAEKVTQGTTVDALAPMVDGGSAALDGGVAVVEGDAGVAQGDAAALSLDGAAATPEGDAVMADPVAGAAHTGAYPRDVTAGEPLPDIIHLPIEFEPDRARPKNVNKAALKRLAREIVTHTGLRYDLIGHTDEADDAWGTRDLASRRATAALNLIRGFGPSKRRFAVHGAPHAPNEGGLRGVLLYVRRRPGKTVTRVTRSRPAQQPTPRNEAPDESAPAPEPVAPPPTSPPEQLAPSPNIEERQISHGGTRR